MRNFWVATIVLGLAGLGGCGGGGLEGELKEFKSRMCACTTKECSDKVQDDFRAWGKDKKKEDEKLSDSDKEKLGAIVKEMRECRSKLRDADKADGDKAGGDKPADKPAEPAAPPTENK